MKKKLWKHILAVRQHAPLVHNITNYVVMNNTANALLAAGASPIMAHAHSEATEMTAISHALLINIGTLDEYWAASMLRAAEYANASGKPWVLDPVGAGATPFRDLTLRQLLSCRPSAIRGNASEITALAQAHKTQTRGADSTISSVEAAEAARSLARLHGSVVCVSGATDIIIGNGQTIFIENGHPLMTRVTGLGCTASALTAAFAGVTEDKTEATAAAMALLGISGELAEKQADGPGSLQFRLLDKLHNISESEFFSTIKLTVQ